jgi:hypothetical protein
MGQTAGEPLMSGTRRPILHFFLKKKIYIYIFFSFKFFFYFRIYRSSFVLLKNVKVIFVFLQDKRAKVHCKFFVVLGRHLCNL